MVVDRFILKITKDRSLPVSSSYPQNMRGTTINKAVFNVRLY